MAAYVDYADSADRCIYTELSRALWSGGSSYESLDKSSCKNVELRDIIYRQTVGRYTAAIPKRKAISRKRKGIVYFTHKSIVYFSRK